MFKIAKYIFIGIFAFWAIGLFSQENQKGIVTVDLTKAEVAKEWHPLHHIKSFRSTPEGIEVIVDGEDPYFAGPPLKLPSEYPLWMVLKLWSEKGGMTQVFYFKNNATEQDSVRFDTPPNSWYEIEIPLPKLGDGYRFRIDPPGNSGRFVLNRISFEPRKEFTIPTWSWKLSPTSKEPALTSGKLSFHLNKENPFGYEFWVGEEQIARGLENMRVAYTQNRELFWVDIKPADVTVSAGDKKIEITASFRDAHQGAWILTYRFTPADTDVIEMTTEVECSQNRLVMFLPLHFLAVGQATWKTNKTQALFAGLEYLDNEPSSSEADIRGPQSRRQTPMPHKITFPLMTITHNGCYIGLIWDNHPSVTALFDSPDRIFNSGGHVMGVLYPGWDGTRRIEGDLLPGSGATIVKGKKLVSKALIIGGNGNTVIPAVQKYVKLKGMPDLPDTGYNVWEYANLAAHGWLKSKIRENNLYRHAYWQGFNPMPAADAAFCEEWLAMFSPQPQADELLKASSEALSAVNPASYFNSGVGHVRVPLTPLVYGNVDAAIKSAYQNARHHLGRFNSDGIVIYKPGSVDYGKTHFTNHANGLTAHAVVNALEAAVFSGDKEVIQEALKRLRQLDVYMGGVPRGAQTWEVPLHTPDILASAHLVKAYAIGYEITGDKQFLDRAIYWAWTGVPFVYLVDPTEKKIGRYSTIAVYGATSWVAPVWMGLPVQWCGLVYADALYTLARQNPDGIWQQLADGITAAGIQHTYTMETPDLAGLLPDSFALREQQRNPPAINPATVQINAVKYYKQIPMYDFKSVISSGLTIHAPGRISVGSADNKSCEFTITPWLRRPYYILVNGLSVQPKVIVNGKDIKTGDLNAEPPVASFTGKNLIIKLNGSQRIKIQQ